MLRFSKTCEPLSNETYRSIGMAIAEAQSNERKEISETLNYLVGTGKFNHLAFSDVIEIANEIVATVDRVEAKYEDAKTDFEEIANAEIF